MLAGTGSDVGKSVLAAALCRIFKQDGYTPAPFKAQNMALNSYVTPEGLEIGRAQAVQAEASAIPCHVDMNPILLKPSSNRVCQVVLLGKPTGNKDAYEYFKTEGRDFYREQVHSAFDRLSQRYNPIVMEGAGSISELNLKDTDLVNMPMAKHAQAKVILVADIDRGGVFASVYGSIMLLEDWERELIGGIIINKFRGDIRLFESGIKKIEQLCNVPVLGVIPYFNHIHIEEEDSVMLQSKQLHASESKINIVVVLLRHLSNFTDFDALEQDARVHLYYSNNTSEIEKADIILIPGSKNTLADLYELRRNGIAQSIVKAAKRGATVMGICGGFQMMGQIVADPDSIEGDIVQLPGLGLLPITTTIKKQKTTRQVSFSFYKEPEKCHGYEIHMGDSTPIEGIENMPLNTLSDGSVDGYMVNERCFGTYIHGILDNASVIDFLLEPYTKKLSDSSFDYLQFKEEQYNKLAQHVREHLDMNYIYEMLSH